MPTPVYVTSRTAAATRAATALRTPPPSPRLQSRYLLISKAIGLIAFLLSPIWISGLLFAGEYEYASAIGLIPLLVVINLGLAVAVTRRDPLLRVTMMSATILKTAAAGAYLLMSYRVYETGADALHYFTIGQDLANGFWSRGDWPFMQPLWSTNLINTLTGYAVIVVGPSLPALFVLFALFSLWGGYFFYRAFCEAFPDGDRGAAALLLFFLPSLVFWTACIGKDAVIAVFLGIVAYGFARVRKRPTLPTYLIIGLGLAGVMAVRPHVAAMLGVSLVFPYLMARNDRGVIGVLWKAAGIAVLAAASVFLVSQAKDFLQVTDFQNASSTIERINKVTRLGGSAFGASSSLPVRAAMAPFLLFRPLPWEAHNVQSGIAAFEGMALLVVFWRNRNRLLKLVRAWRANTYVLFIVLYAVEFCVTFSAASSNFGTLSRMRAMLLPFALMLLCAPPLLTRRPERR